VLNEAGVIAVHSRDGNQCPEWAALAPVINALPSVSLAREGCFTFGIPMFTYLTAKLPTNPLGGYGVIGAVMGTRIAAGESKREMAQQRCLEYFK
jgi:hypothetical protein